MGGAVAVGRIGGVLVRVHWSALVIAGLLAHGLTHAVVARRNGVRNVAVRAMPRRR